MNQTNYYKQLGEWLNNRYQISVIVCRIYGKRWAFDWSNTDDIENARRIQLTANTGLIVPADVSDELAKAIEQQALLYWQNQ